jgi:mono/diheme cytochrome c family protein
MRGAAAGLVVALAFAVACDNRQVWHAPDPTLARMLEQPKADPYEATSAFADGKTMREPPPGTVPHDAVEEGVAPIVTHASLVAGRTSFELVCATCHGILGDGVSVVATKMRRRPPPSLHEARYRALSREQLYVVVTNGYGLMPSYSDMLTADERWSTVAYVQALQLSQCANVAALPPDVRAALARETGAR